jgi:hypothetical protein
VRRAAELLGRPLHYVADLPYLFNYPEHLEPNTAGMKKKVERVSRAGLGAWKEAILAYESQISMLFKSQRAMRGRFNRFVSEFGGQPFWERA